MELPLRHYPHAGVVLHSLFTPQTVKHLFSGTLTLRDYEDPVTEATTMFRVLNKMTLADVLESVRIA